MKTPVTALGSFPTDTEIADAVAGPSLALAREDTVVSTGLPTLSA